MKVEVGYCDNPDSHQAGQMVARDVLSRAQRREPCDFALLFCTAAVNEELLRESVAAELGKGIPIYGGGAVGVITNDVFGYAGSQVGLACFWLDDSDYRVFTQGGLLEDEEKAGRLLGEQLKAAGVAEDSPLMMFYDAVDTSGGGVRLLMATWILAGLKKGLGYLPALTGAGLQGDHVCTPTSEFTGEGLDHHQIMALAFSEDIHIDSVIMHGCRPASGYYTVTKADGPVILEINGEPAIPFIDKVINSSVQPQDYPFFLLFGINHGDKWGDYDENKYASRLCLGIDPERNGIVMFEPDMVAGTEFQLMFRSMDFDYMKPKVESLFDSLGEREPFFAVYIDCAGRCAGYGGIDIEDAVAIQESVGGRVPLLGLYTGVEIAPVEGNPRGLDWTGVFCLFSQGSRKADEQPTTAPEVVGEDVSTEPQLVTIDARENEKIKTLSEQNLAKVLALDTQLIQIRHELELKRRGFHLLSELAVSLRTAKSYSELFEAVAKRINAALNMQKTIVLEPEEGGCFVPVIYQGYSPDEVLAISGENICLPGELLDPEASVMVTGADPEERLQGLREAIKLPYFIASPIVINNEVVAVLLTGRMVEQTPYLSRLGTSEVESVQAITALMASTITHQRLEAAEERNRSMISAMPLSCVFWDEKGDLIECNEEALRMFGADDKETFLRSFYSYSPAEQPDGSPSEATIRKRIIQTFIKGSMLFKWQHQDSAGLVFPVEITLVRVSMGEYYSVVGYIRDLREQEAAMEEIRAAKEFAEKSNQAKSQFLATITHEIRTPLSSIIAMAKAVSDMELDPSQRSIIENGLGSAHLLNGTIATILDYSHLEDGNVELKRNEFAVTDVIKHIKSILTHEAEDKGLELKALVAQDVPGKIIGDRQRFEQVIFNIAANAIKFTEKGEVDIKVQAFPSKQPGKTGVRVEVMDTGVEIAPEKQEEIFKPLTQIDSSYTRKHEGLGMGLAISQALVKLMGGEITYQSRETGGSNFVLDFEFELPKAEETVVIEDKYKELANMKVLVAEDNPINQLIITEVLKKVGIETTAANNGAEALKAVESDQFDIVLMDVQMPEMDGLTATSKIRENAAYDEMPILAMTANASEDHRRESFESGMNDHLTKPIDVEEVYDALLYWGKKIGKS